MVSGFRVQGLGFGELLASASDILCATNVAAPTAT